MVSSSPDAPAAACGRVPPYSYAFQPIVDAEACEVYAYEALIRGPHGEPASGVFAQVPAADLHQFDRESRVVALDLAGRLGLTCHLTLNALPRSLCASDAGLRALVDVAARWHVPLDRLVLEITEGEAIDDPDDLRAVVDEYRGAGIQIAIDDFGAGYSGLNLLADLQPDVIKLDMHLVRGIEARGPRQSIARAIGGVCQDLGIDIIAEGVETRDEYAWFADAGVRLFQGYLFARPGFECLPPARYG